MDFVFFARFCFFVFFVEVMVARMVLVVFVDKHGYNCHVSKLGFTLSELTAISPLDGRYRSQVASLVPFVSELALIQTRISVEAAYLVKLSDVGFIRSLTIKERLFLQQMGSHLTIAQI